MSSLSLSLSTRAVHRHAGPPPVLSTRGEDVDQSQLWGSPAQHESDQWEAASAAGRALLPVLTGEHSEEMMATASMMATLVSQLEGRPTTLYGLQTGGSTVH